jgi:Flp pilus assembly protein TadG
MEAAMRRGRRGSIAVELAIVIPIFMIVIMGGLQLGRGLLVKHDLESAVSHVARASAIANRRDPAAIRNAILAELGSAANACKSIATPVRVIPGTGGTPDALEVRAECELVPLFTQFLGDKLKRVAVVVAMPLPPS